MVIAAIIRELLRQRGIWGSSIQKTQKATRKKFCISVCWYVHRGRYKFSTICIFARKFKFYHWQETLSITYLEVTDSRCSFPRKRLPKTKVWMTALCQSSKKNYVPQKRVTSSFSSSFKHLWKCNFPKTSNILHVAEMLYVCIPFSHTLKSWRPAIYSSN